MFQVTTLDLNQFLKHRKAGLITKKIFLAKPANLTVSGQLEGELGALALGLFTPSDQHSGQKTRIRHDIWPSSG
jgi:hypothetical protein